MVGTRDRQVGCRRYTFRYPESGCHLKADFRPRCVFPVYIISHTTGQHTMLTHFDHVFGRSYFRQTDDSEAETSPIERSRRAESIPAISRSDSTNEKSSEATGPPHAPKLLIKIMKKNEFQMGLISRVSADAFFGYQYGRKS